MRKDESNPARLMHVAKFFCTSIEHFKKYKHGFWAGSSPLRRQGQSLAPCA